MIKDRPPRLGLVFVHEPLYFVTFVTWDRKQIPSLSAAQRALECYADRGARDFSNAVSRYVIMPDHIHLFVRGCADFVLSRWVAGLKRAIISELQIRGRFWQPSFFDHLLRSDESYSEKWRYLRENPVRAGLVNAAEDWPYQGEIVVIPWV